MAKLTLNDLATLDASMLTSINSNNTAIENALENTLSRDGTSPNTMGADLDMDGNSILNLPTATAASEPVRLDQVEELVPDIFVQNSAPATSGPDGSLWIDADSTDIDLYRLASAAWVDTSVNLKGATGATGAAGANGEVIHSGSVADNDIAVFDGATGTIIKSGGTTLSAIGLTIGNAITGGTDTRILRNNAGVLGEYTISGSGTVVAMATSPVLTTPALGVATGTSLALNGATIGSNAFAVTGLSALGSTLTITPSTEVSPLILTGGTLAGTTSRPLIDATQTWNNSGLTATAVLVSITDTSSNASSLLFDFKVGGSSVLTATKLGQVRASGTGGALPALSFQNDPNTGIHSSGSDILEFHAGGSRGCGYTNTDGGSFHIWSGGRLTWNSSTGIGGTGNDLFLRRRGAANLAFGGTDAAAPVAQTLSVQSVVAGTSNTAGVNWTFTASQGTGTGAGGNFLWQIAPAGSSGSSQNSLQTAMELASSGALTITPRAEGVSALTLTGGTLAGTTSSPLISGTQTWNNAGLTATGLLLNITDTSSNSASKLFDFQRSGTSFFTLTKAGTMTIGDNTPATITINFDHNSSNMSAMDVTANRFRFAPQAMGSAATLTITHAGGLSVSRDQAIGWASSATGGDSQDTMLTRFGAAVTHLGSGSAASPVAQTLGCQGSRSGTDTNVGGASLTIRSGIGTGTGAASSLILQSPVLVASGTGAQTSTTGLTINQGTAVYVGYTVATLPATPSTGARCYVTDANATTFASTVAGGGANVVPVFYNGTNWIIA